MSFKADLSEYTIRIPSSDQEEQYWRARIITWGNGQTWDEFKALMIRVRSLGGWTEDGAVCPWVLVRRDDLDGTIYAGCETFRRKSFLKNPGEDIIQEVFSYGIASVICPTEHQRQGFPTRLLSLVHYQISLPSSLPSFPTSEWGPPPPPLSAKDSARLPPGIASILFSDIGPVFYSKPTIGIDRPGWIVRDEDCQQISWKLHTPSSKEVKYDWIYAQELPNIGLQLSQATRKRMSKDYKETTHPVWSPDPSSAGILSYVPYTAMSVRRLQTWEQTLQKEPCGIRIPASQPGEEEAIVLFTVFPLAGNPIGRALLITCIHNLDVGRLPRLLEALDQAADGMGVEEGWVWGISPASELGKGWMGQEGRKVKAGRRQELDGHLIGIAWYGDTKERGEMVDTQMWSWC